MGNEWKTYRLGELFETASGLSKSRKEFGFGSPFVSFRDVFWNTFLPDELESLANTSEKEQEKCSVKKGDIFLTRTSETPNELGMSAVALKDYPQATFNGFTKRLRLKKGINVDIDPVYLGYYLRSNKFRQSIFAHSTMTTRASLNNSSISILEIDLPPIDGQIKIGKQLKALDDKIALNRQMNQTLEQMAQTLFKSWFVDFDPVIDNALQAGNEIPESLQKRAQQRKAPGEKQKPLPQHIQQLFPAEFEFSEELDKWVPRGWRAGQIKDVAEVVGGGTPSTKVDEYFCENGIAWLSPKDLSGYEWKFISKGAKDITQLGLKNSSARLMPKGTVLFSSRAPIGYVAIAENEITTNQGFKSLVPKEEICSEYLYYFLKTNIENIEAIATGSTFKEVSGNAIKSFVILIPSTNILDVYQQKTKVFNSKSLLIQKEVNSLTKLRDTILPKLVNGDINEEKLKIPNQYV